MICRRGLPDRFLAGPWFETPAIWADGTGTTGDSLSERDRQALGAFATIVRLCKGETIYRQGQPARSVFNITSGVAKSYVDGADQAPHIVCFLFPGDLFGLAHAGRYVNTVEAVTPLTAYRLPVAALERRLYRKAGLDFLVICKLCHELREAQRHAYLLSRHSAAAKIALFLQMLEAHGGTPGGLIAEVLLPMSRADIAQYTGLSPEAVTRALHALAADGTIRMRNRRHIEIIDRGRLTALAAERKITRHVA